MKGAQWMDIRSDRQQDQPEDQEHSIDPPAPDVPEQPVPETVSQERTPGVDHRAQPIPAPQEGPATTSTLRTRPDTGLTGNRARLVSELQTIVAPAEAQTVNVQNFLKIVKKYTEPTELTPALLHEFVEKVVVHAPDKSSGHRVQRIDIHYNFIGEIDLSPEYSKKTTA